MDNEKEGETLDGNALFIFKLIGLTIAVLST